MNKSGNLRVGVYVDVSNIAMNGGYGIHYDVLREFACRNHGTAIRLNAYVAYNAEEAIHNSEYKKKALSFHAVLRDYGYKVVIKQVKWFIDEKGQLYAKANADLDMAVDALMQSERLDYVLLVTGDGDFVQVVRALQNKGCRVEVLAFENVSHELRNEADVFFSGFSVPDLIPIQKNEESHVKWGELNSRVRGICYAYYHDKGFGFMRVMKHLSGGTWITDSRDEGSPYITAFVHHSQFPEDIDLKHLPNREQIFEFKIVDSEKGIQAVDITPVYHY